MQIKFDIGENVLVPATVQSVAIDNSGINYDVTVFDGSKTLLITQSEDKLIKNIAADNDKNVALQLYKDILLDKLEAIRLDYTHVHGMDSKPTVELDVIRDIIRGGQYDT